MSWVRAARFIALGLALSYGFPAACGSGGVVGGKCRSGYTNCNGKCTDLETDARSCGACGNECSDDLACVQSKCGGEDGDITLPIGGAPGTGGATNQGGNENGGVGQGGELPDGGFLDSPVDGQGDAGDALIECLPPHDAPSHCGDCETECAAPSPFCAPDGNGSFECVPLCEDPLIECGGQCLDPATFNSDPENCGGCGNLCPSGICQGGDCVGAQYGNEVFLCMNFASTTQASAPTTLLGNAIFLPARNPVNVLSYTRGANAAAVAKVNQVINWAGMARGRSAAITAATTANQVTVRLNIMDFSVLLIHDLADAAPGDLAQTGGEWGSGVLSSFAGAGGVVVVLDGGGGTGEMHELISSANLLNVTGQTAISGSEACDSPGDCQVWNQAPFDTIGSNVLSPFLGRSRTCTFDTNEANDLTTLFVLTDAESGGDPVVIHRVIAP